MSLEGVRDLGSDLSEEELVGDGVDLLSGEVEDTEVEVRVRVPVADLWRAVDALVPDALKQMMIHNIDDGQDERQSQGIKAMREAR